MQANGAEMLRIACCLGTERGVRICAPVHDAILIEAPIDEIEAERRRMQSYMRKPRASCSAGSSCDRSGDHPVPQQVQRSPREMMWNRVLGLIAKAGASECQMKV